MSFLGINKLHSLESNLQLRLVRRDDAVLLPGAEVLTKLGCLFWFKTNGANDKIGTSGDSNHTWLQLKCKLASNGGFDKKQMWSLWQWGPNFQVNVSGIIFGSLRLWSEAWNKKKCTSSSGQCFLILNSCWLLALCLSWKKFDPKSMCEPITFPVLWTMCDSQRDEAPWAACTSRTSLMKQNMLSWETLLPSNYFCFSGSTVSYDLLGIYLMRVWGCFFKPQQKGLIPFWHFSDSRGEKCQEDKCYSSLCEEQQLFHELGVTFQDLLCGSLVR